MKSKWTPPDGQFASLDFFINKCLHDINKLNSNCNPNFFNLSSEKKAALENLSKRRDIIVKAANKGNALVVWRAKKKLCGNFLTPHPKVDEDFTSTNGKQIGKSTITSIKSNKIDG